MSAVYFTREFQDSIMQIAYELKRMNELKEKELYLKYGDKEDYKYIKTIHEL